MEREAQSSTRLGPALVRAQRHTVYDGELYGVNMGLSLLSIHIPRQPAQQQSCWTTKRRYDARASPSRNLVNY